MGSELMLRPNGTFEYGRNDGNMVGVMLLQSGGYFACFAVYDLSDIPHPYGLPEMKSLRPWETGLSQNG
jgi:hypothetical protein